MAVSHKKSVDSSALCSTCDQFWSGDNAVYLARKHCEKTGHTTSCDKLTHVQFENNGIHLNDM